jgi:glutamine synthetase type III
LYIPSCFFSWDQSYALDEKIPLLRSEVALARESMRLFAVLEETKHTRVHMDAGLEQEFFLIDREYFMKRPDLMVGIAKTHTNASKVDDAASVGSCPMLVLIGCCGSLPACCSFS